MSPVTCFFLYISFARCKHDLFEIHAVLSDKCGIFSQVGYNCHVWHIKVFHFFRRTFFEMRSNKKWVCGMKNAFLTNFLIHSYSYWIFFNCLSKSMQMYESNLNLFWRFDANKSTKGASKLRRDLINAEIANLRELLPLPPSTRQRLSQLQLMALVCVYVRKANYFQQGKRFVYYLENLSHSFIRISINAIYSRM